MAGPFEWHLESILRRTEPDVDFALIVLNQPLEETEVVQELWKRARIRVASDGAANRLYDLVKKGERRGGPSIYDSLDVIIGDLDSLEDDSRAYFTTQTARPTRIIHETEQESTDFGKAIDWVRSSAASASSSGVDNNQDVKGVDEGKTPLSIVALGGLGGRIDQGISVLHYLYLFQPGPAYDLGRIYLLSEENMTVLLQPGKHVLRMRDDNEESGGGVWGKYVGILPMLGSSVLTTTGLRWDVVDWPTSFLGKMSTSNHLPPETKVVTVETTEAVLFTVSLKGTG
ncbi:unnamed protein product [Parascedosporium putredinis]|uniref:Thiamine pyrophosphokinase n=1 Tax=Parascedosporium putredinis TaxID=1442378 RepID=A0A9P1M7I5_9PEZI|nr:unnamed protein product [Parascedosporium putredinis]CAI7991753.1 unnamed protein product [Parascedosporium putredinis]